MLGKYKEKHFHYDLDKWLPFVIFYQCSVKHVRDIFDVKVDNFKTLINIYLSVYYWKIIIEWGFLK